MRADVAESGAGRLHPDARDGSQQVTELPWIPALDLRAVDEHAASGPPPLAEVVHARIRRSQGEVHHDHRHHPQCHHHELRLSRFRGEGDVSGGEWRGAEREPACAGRYLPDTE